ncbi:serine/threonine protein kinase [Stackebrandtia nassauensis]|uniref:non-specific serine/threonine protein kinase n=1 Tax=Stackebrandtia nassauensis (strain DSM 44728 / CIP 108903 / NRRL B-16338 / NBRC 102104 / LLR-40K-21) TaxID=446470 RepID=D3PYJ2_STANL|nr:serine/threonine-protein kinase [Stackebrandtia nassauensis]ADD41559.1 serine/threonine protein kinase [Stackebrandtia nassauensis DSM 44728]
MNQVLADRYRIDTELARGAAGVVHRAHDRITGEDVAIKILHADAASEPAVATAFLDEAEVLTELNHPGIVRPRDLIVNGTLMALVMDLVDGVDLRRVVIDGGPLPSRRAAVVVSEVAEALAAVHAKGIIHGDVKPGNILIPSDGGSVRLVDFGVARRIASPDAPTHATPDYTAPEIVDGGHSTDKSDVYGLGLVLYEALCGVSPYRGGSIDDVLDRHRAMIPLRPETVVAELWSIIESCLALDPADRPGAQAIPSMLRATMPLLSDEAADAVTPRLAPRPPVTPPEPMPFLAPTPVTPAAGDAPPTSVVPASPVAILGESSETKGRNKSKLLIAAAAGIVVIAAAGVLGFAWLAGATVDDSKPYEPQADEQTSEDPDSKDTKDKKNNDDSTPSEEPSSTDEPSSSPTGESGGENGTGGDSGEENGNGGSEGDFPGEGPIGSTFPDKPGGR